MLIRCKRLLSRDVRMYIALTTMGLEVDFVGGQVTLGGVQIVQRNSFFQGNAMDAMLNLTTVWEGEQSGWEGHGPNAPPPGSAFFVTHSNIVLS